MIAASATPAGGWAWIVAIVVFAAALAALALDRVRLRRQAAAHEADAALLRTDLADAQQQIAALRDCLRAREAGAGALPGRADRPGDADATVV